MHKFIGIAAACAALTGCAGGPAPATLQNLYAVEASARRMAPQDDVAVLYLMATERHAAHPITVRINGEVSLDGPIVYEHFYVYYLPPGKYEIVYGADMLPADKGEIIEAKARDILVRDFVQSMTSIVSTSISYSSIDQIDPETARNLVSSKRIGVEQAYAAARFRCRQIK